MQGDIDVPLDDVGRRQAERLARAFRGIPLRAVYASPLSRAMQTAAPLAQAQGLEITVDARLKERHWGAYQGSTRAEASRLYPEAEEELRRAPRTARPPGGESFEDVCRRVDAALREIGAGEGKVAAVCHGGSIVAGLQMLLGIGGWPLTRCVIDNASVSLVDLTPRGEVIAHFINRNEPGA